MRRVLLLSLVLAVGAGCGDGVAPPTIAIGSPTAAQQVFGNRELAVTGTVGGEGITAVTVAVNGGAPAAATISSGAFSGSVTLADGANTIVAAVSGAGGEASATVLVAYVPAPTISIVAPVEGQRITGGSRAFEVTGTVGGEGLGDVTVTVNGGAPVTATVAGGTFTASVTLADRDNLIEATVSGSGGQASASVQAYYPFLSLETFQAADLVLGQADFTQNARNRGGAAGADTLGYLYGNPACEQQW
jgi:hypothetical protein